MSYKQRNYSECMKSNTDEKSTDKKLNSFDEATVEKIIEAAGDVKKSTNIVAHPQFPGDLSTRIDKEEHLHNLRESLEEYKERIDGAKEESLMFGGVMTYASRNYGKPISAGIWSFSSFFAYNYTKSIENQRRRSEELEHSIRKKSFEKIKEQEGEKIKDVAKDLCIKNDLCGTGKIDKDKFDKTTCELFDKYNND